MVREPEAFAGDVASAGIVLGSLSGILPQVAALLSILWLIIRIYESDTVVKWLTRNDETKKGDDK